jgi:phage baseplate assembly protein W
MPSDTHALNVDFLGRGWQFPVSHEGSRILLTGDERNIEDSIWIILATAPGERVMRADFGCGIHRLVFEVNEARTINRIQQEVRHALIRWEPRIDLLEVAAETKNQGEELLITVHYRVRTTNNFFNLVFPFYLAGSEKL